MADAAREAGCRVVALTDSTVAPIALHADCTLLFSIDSPSFFPSITAGVAVAEALVEQLLAKKGKGAIKALEDAGVMPYVKRFAGASAGQRLRFRISYMRACAACRKPASPERLLVGTISLSFARCAAWCVRRSLCVILLHA